MTSLRIAVASDIHAGTNSSEWTHVLAASTAFQRGTQPLSDLGHYIDDSGLKADYLVVPGDIADKADAVGLDYGWRQVHSIANRLEAKLVAVPGNHDVVTRSESADPRALLKNLLPSFPFDSPTIDQHFWDKGWSIVEQADHRILTIDSTFGFPKFPAGYGDGDEKWDEYLKALDRGSFPDSIEQDLDAYFRTANPSFNIAVIHHHPQEHQLKSFLQDEYGAMHRGPDLLDLLSRHPRIGRWILIHGHRHIPQLVNAVTVTSNGPLIVCAASLGAKLWSPVNTVARNQFHIIEATDQDASFPGSMRGRIESYTWGYGVGWYDSERQGVGLPSMSGFGFSDDYRLVSYTIASHMEANKLKFLKYSELLKVAPQLPYMLPQDFEFLEGDLEDKGFSFMRDRQNRLSQLSRVD